jgi:ComF family protein
VTRRRRLAIQATFQAGLQVYVFTVNFPAIIAKIPDIAWSEGGHFWPSAGDGETGIAGSCKERTHRIDRAAVHRPCLQAQCWSSSEVKSSVQEPPESPLRHAAAVAVLAKEAWTGLLALLAPPTCVYCQQTTDLEAAICHSCLGELKLNSDACPRCALPGCRGSLCPGCQRTESALDRIVAPYVYDAAMSLLLKRWKFEKQRYCGDIAAKLLLNADYRPEEGSILLATPLHWGRRLQRGFNQSEDLLRFIEDRAASGSTGSPPGSGRAAGPRPLRLVRQRATEKQSLSTRQQRRANLAGAFRVVGDARGRSVVLIDDICTTGMTGESMARALREAGAASVSLWCIARTPSHR